MGGLSLVGLTKSYGALQTLKGIDLALDQGEFLVLLGPSGCGKSTLLNIIAGLLEPSSGQVSIDGKPLNGVHPKDRDIAMVFQNYALYPNLTVSRNIGFGLEMRGVGKAERDLAIARVAGQLQITPLLDRLPGALSGGQRQRVAIGRALVRNPAVFLFDEPLSNLDAKLRLETRTEIKRLHQNLGKTMIYVTHDQIEAMTLATRIAVMNGGRVEQLGTPEDVYRRPESLFVAGFVGSPGMNLLPAKVSNGQIELEDGTVLMQVPEAYRNLPDAMPLVVGIRPENLSVVAGPVAGSLSAMVEVVELTGPEKQVSFRLGQQTLTASLPPMTNIRAGETRILFPAKESIVFFATATGRRINPDQV